MNTVGWRCANCSEVNGSEIYRCRSCHVSRQSEDNLEPNQEAPQEAKASDSQTNKGCLKVALVVVLLILVAILVTIYRYAEAWQHFT